MMMGLGDKQRDLPTEFNGSLPADCARPVCYLPGTLVVQGKPYADAPKQAAELAGYQGIGDWPVILLVDSSREATLNLQEFLWTFFTRFEPAADIHGATEVTKRFHVGLTPPIVFDCRMKPWYTEILEVDPDTKALVDKKFATMIPPHLR